MKISVVTPSFNQGQFIERTIRSVLSQDWPELEYVVFDGGSRDETVSILKRYEDRLRWTSGPDGGQTDAVNKGIVATNGEIIGWLNSDDVYYPGAVARVMEHFAAHPEVGVVYGMADHIDADDKPFEDYPTEPWDFARLQQVCFLCQPAVFFRRSVVERDGMLDTGLHYCMDYEFWLRLGRCGVRFDYIPHKLAGSRMYADNKTLGARVRVHREINDMFLSQFGRVPTRWLSNYAHVTVQARVDRDRHPTRFLATLIVQIALAGLRWNRAIDREMRQLIFEAGSALRASLRQRA